MSKSIPGNPHVHPGPQIAKPHAVNEYYIAEDGITSETMMLSELARNTEATLALAYEYRTANLIATMHVFEIYEETQDLQGNVLEQITTRLGLDGDAS